MDEDIKIINEKTRNEKIKIFLIENKKIIISTITVLIFLILSFYSYKIYLDSKKQNLSDRYNSAIIDYNNGVRDKAIISLKKVIIDKDSTYSPLALYFLIDNNLIDNRIEVNKFFDIVINKISLETEIKNLIIYKKALYNADYVDENELLNILKPLLNTSSVWKSHALYLAAEFFYSKNEKEKAKEFFNQIITTENPNQDIINQAQKRLNRDLSE